MEIKALIDRMRKDEECTVFPHAGFPEIESNLVLSDDLNVFYQECGGVRLFKNSTFPTTIASPKEFKPANRVIFAGLVSDEILSSIKKDDISWSWYLIGVGPNSQYITIDLDKSRLGNCYNSFWVNHPRDSDIIATSFTELLSRLLDTRGKYYYWDIASFKSLGNPYE